MQTLLSSSTIDISKRKLFRHLKEIFIVCDKATSSLESYEVCSLYKNYATLDLTYVSDDATAVRRKPSSSR